VNKGWFYLARIEFADRFPAFFPEYREEIRALREWGKF
jgi:hypothetical protein